MKKDLKNLIEKRNEKLVKMDELTEKAINEERAFSDEEKTEFEELEAEVRALSDTVEKCRAEYDKEMETLPEEKRAEIKTEEAEERAFAEYIRGNKISDELRAESNFTLGDNGAVIPKSIVNRIFEEVKERSNIFNEAEKFYAGGTLSFPVYEETEEKKIEMAYAEEFKDLTASSGQFKNIDLTGYLAGALVKVSRSLLNNSQFDLLSFIISKVAEKVSDFIEQELFNGTEGKITGLSKLTAVSEEVTEDNIITLQDSVLQCYQSRCHWIMNNKTKDKIRHFKTTDGDYYLVRDYSNDGYNWSLLGKGVELTDAVKDDTVYYGDFSGLKIKIAEEPNLQVLNELFAIQHAIGVVAWCEIDANVIEPQKIKCIKAAGE